MFKNYFKIAVRQLRKQKMYSVIKTGGFALGIAACLLIALFIKDELSYDRSYPDAARIYRITGSADLDGKTLQWTAFPPPMAKAMAKDFVEIQKSGRLMRNNLFPGAGSNEVRTADKNVNTHEDGFMYADQEMLDMLQLPMVYGNRQQALAQPNTIVIAKSKADKYFPNQNPVGKALYLNNNKQPLTITGVMQDIPATSHLHEFSFLLTLSGVEWWKGEQTSWGSNNYDDYIMMQPGIDIAAFEKKLTTDIARNYYLPSMTADGDKDAEKELATFKLHLQPVTDIHLRSADIQDRLTHGDIRFVWLFGAIALFILIIACINFINLSTAKSANRAKEVGLRKVVGSYRSSLVQQFLTESLLFSFISFIAGLLIAWALLPYFNTLASKSIHMPWGEWWLVPVVLLSAIVVGTIAGLYPAFYLSSFKPINVLKGQLSTGSKSSLLRNGLVVFQFTTSIILIISTVVIYNQTHYILNKKLGYDKEQVMLLHGANTLGPEVKTLKTELQKLAHVQSVSISDFLPVAGTKRNGNSFWPDGKKGTDGGVDGQFWIVDNDYLKTLGIKVVAGRDFNPALATDSAGVIINQSMADKLHMKDPVGRQITNGGGHFPIIGVVADFNFESLRENVGPLIMQLGSSPSIVSVKINTADVAGTVASVGELWKRLSPGQPIRYTFLDENFTNMYADVQRMGRIFTSFALLAIVIACLGLFALSAFMAEQRSKEIGIRKVLGASVGSITTLLSKDFIKLVVVSIVIASPIAWWAMTRWLEDFANRAGMQWWMFVIAGLAAILIAVITVSFQSLKAALTNPVKSLKAE